MLEELDFQAFIKRYKIPTVQNDYNQLNLKRTTSALESSNNGSGSLRAVQKARTLEVLKGKWQKIRNEMLSQTLLERRRNSMSWRAT